jgi:hypothetical protein
MNFGEWIEYKLAKMGKSKAWLLRRTNISQGSVERWVRGQQPSLDSVLIVCKSIARFEGVPVHRIINQSTKNNPILWR